MAIAIDPHRSIRYVLREDRALPLESQTVFLLKVLSARELAQIEDAMSVVTPGGDVCVRTGSQTLRTLELGLTGWENFKRPDGAMLAFDAATKSVNWDYLRPEWRRELSHAILEQTRLTGDQEKN